MSIPTPFLVLAGPSSPILHIETSIPPSPTSVPVPPKRLRSCLSPSRRPPSPGPFGTSMSIISNASTDEPSLTCSSSPMTSRSASFSSQDGGDYWRRGRNVRWDESEGCVLAAYYSTWSADDYDRSPLEPPKPEERACLMPARGSRCLSPLDCFADLNPDEAFFPRQSYPIVAEPLPIVTLEAAPALTPDSEETDCQEADAEDKEWEECMERRRMMFAQMCRPSAPAHEEEEEKEEQRRFEGYTSISASLVALLAQSGIRAEAQHRDVATPVGTPVEVEEAYGAFGIGGRPKMVRVEHRLRVSSLVEDEVVEEAEEDAEDVEEDEEEEEGGEEPSAEMVFAALRAMRMGPGRDMRTGAEERDRVD